MNDKIDSFSCELPGGIFPLLELSLSAKDRDKVALEIALQYDAYYVEIGNSRKKVNVNFKIPAT